MADSPSWDDLRVVLAVSRSRTLQDAASRLGVTHGTVSRRLTALDKQLGDRVFSRAAAGYAPTPLGERLVAAALRMEAAAVDLEHALLTSDADVAGRLRISTLSLFVRALSPALAQFRAAHPHVHLSVGTSRLPVRLDRNEAQVVIRATDQPPETLVGRSMGRLVFAPYAARRLVDQHGVDPLALPWLDWSDPWGKRHTAEWWAAHAPSITPVGELEVFEDMLAAVLAGVGAAIVPCLDGDAQADLVRVADPIPSFSMGVWLLTHPAVRDAPRVRAFMAHIGEALAAMRPLLEGTGAGRLAAETP